MSTKLVARNPDDRTLDWILNLQPQARRHHANKLRHGSRASGASRVTHNSAPGISVATDSSNSRPEFSDETVTLQYGPEPDARSFRIRKELLDNATPLFRGTTEPRIVFQTKMVKTDLVVFKIFIHWLSHSEDPVPYLPCHYSQEPWRSRAVDVWLFAKRICASSLERYALSQVVRNCAVQNSSAFAYIEREAKADSALRRFSNHWVAWNCYLAPEGQSEYANLAAAKLASVVNNGTNDPRIFEIEHWYSPCGNDINSSCIHDPIVRENAVTELFASRRPRPEWGLKWEAENKASREKQNPVPLTLKAKSSNAAIKLKPPPPLPPRTNSSAAIKPNPSPRLPPRKNSSVATKLNPPPALPPRKAQPILLSKPK